MPDSATVRKPVGIARSSRCCTAGSTFSVSRLRALTPISGNAEVQRAAQLVLGVHLAEHVHVEVLGLQRELLREAVLDQRP